MKNTKPFVLVLLTLAGLIAASVAQSPSPVKTQPPAPAPAAAASPSAVPARAGDPFDKHQGGKPPGDAAPPDIVCFTVEVYALAQDDAAKLLEDNPGGEARHDAVLKLAGEGKARFEVLLSDVTKSGQRTVVEQEDEVRYPTEYQPSPVPGEPPMPTAFETRNTGQTLELEPVTSPDHSVCDINMALSLTHFNGFAEFGGARPQDPTVAQPKFDTGKFTTSMTLVMGKLLFLGTLSAPPQFADDAGGQAAPQQVRLAFGRASLVPVPSGTSGPLEEGFLMEHQLVFYSMDREAARKILAGDPAPGAYYAGVQALAAKQEAHLERLTVLKAKSGQRAVAEEIDEVRYPSDYGFFQKDKSAEETEKAMPVPVPPTPVTAGALGAPASPGTPAPAQPSVYVTILPVQTPAASGTTYKPGSDQDYLPACFETRNAGLTLEIEPVAQKSIVDINMAPQIVRDIGGLQGNGVARKYPAIPVFETSKVTTSLASPMGVYAYIGTFTPPGDTGVNGRKDTGKVWLGFIRTVYAQP